MAIFPKWLKEFPREFLSNFRENWRIGYPEFKEGISTGVKTLAKGTAGIVKAVASPFIIPILIVSAIIIIGFIMLKRLKIL